MRNLGANNEQPQPIGAGATSEMFYTYEHFSCANDRYCHVWCLLLFMTYRKNSVMLAEHQVC